LPKFTHRILSYNEQAYYLSDKLKCSCFDNGPRKRHECPSVARKNFVRRRPSWGC